MAYIALTSTQTEGTPFRVPLSGLYDAFVENHPGGNGQFEIQGTDGTWRPMDARGEDQASWKGDGGGQVPMSVGRRYRANADTAGATVTVVSLITTVVGHSNVDPYADPDPA